MAKFCTKCGSPLAEDVKFCGTCGTAVPVQEPAPVQAAPVQAPAPAPVQPAPTPVQPVYQAPAEAPVAAPAPKKKGKAGLIIGVLLVVVALIVAAVLIPWGDIFGGSDDDSEGGSAAAAGSPEDAVNLYYDALYEGKANNLKSLAPQGFWDWAEDTYGVTAKDVVSFFKEELQEDYVDEMKDQYGKNYTVTFRVEKEIELDDEALESIAEFLNDEYGIKESSVTGAVQLAGVVEAKGSDGEDSDDMDELYAVQIDGKWYYAYVGVDDYSYVSFPLSGLVIMASEEMGNYAEDADDIPLQDEQNTAAPAPNPPETDAPARDEQVEEMRDIDPVVKLQNIWDAYLSDYDSFYAVGGDPDYRLDDAPALHDTYYRENLMGTYKVPEEWLDSIEKVATFTDGYVANDFCSAVYVLDNELSDFQVEDFMSAMGQNLLNTDWEGYTPGRILVGLIEDGCVLVAFGTEERIVSFANAARGAYGVQTVYETPIN